MKKRFTAAVLIILILLLCTGCGAGKATRSALKNIGALDDQGAFTGAVRIDYYAQQPSAVQLDAAQAAQIYEALQQCKGGKAAEAFSPEASAEAAVTFTGTEGETVLYYCPGQQLLVCRYETAARDDSIAVQYELLTSGEAFISLLQQFKAAGIPTETQYESQLHSLDELKDQLDKSQLNVEAARQIQTEDCPADIAIEGNICRVYDHAALQQVGEEQLLITALCANEVGGQGKYQILGVYSNEKYTLVHIAAELAAETDRDEQPEEPDAAQDDGEEPDENKQDAQTEQTGPCAVIAAKADINLDNWVVFIDTDHTVRAIVVPAEWGLGQQAAQ